MSHAATNWAIEQRGLKPAAKIVLWHLCDCHNPVRGCFPGQEYLANVCEMSRASVNTHLNTLQGKGLIKRIVNIDPDTRKQLPTEYKFPFQPEFEDLVEGQTIEGNPWSRVRNLDTGSVSKNEAIPCPNLSESRVQILDTNPVKEPVKEPSARKAAGDPDGPPPSGTGGRAASGDGASGEGAGSGGASGQAAKRGLTEREHLLLAQRTVITDWLIGSMPYEAVLKSAGIKPDISRDDLDEIAPRLDPVALNAICGLVRWAHRCIHADPAVKPPKAPVIPIIRALTNPETKAMTQWRCARLLDAPFLVDERPVNFGEVYRPGSGSGEDQGTEQMSERPASEASPTGRPQAPASADAECAEGLNETKEDAA